MNIIFENNKLNEEKTNIRFLLSIFKTKRKQVKIDMLYFRNQQFFSKGQINKIKKHYSCINARSYKINRFKKYKTNQQIVEHK